MALEIDIEQYLARIVQTEESIERKRQEFEAAADPHVKSTIERTLSQLEDLHGIFVNIVTVLADLEDLKDRAEKRVRAESVQVANPATSINRHKY